MASFNSGAASSSQPITGPWTYDVFLSFRGEDTRLNFVDHLYAALSRTGIVTYKDDENLGRGELISPTLLKAIEESRFAVVVFSENYANSSWCLDELVKIMECRDQMGQKVFPVFYHVDPSDVRGQKRSFSAAFQQKEEKFRGETEKLSSWREALVTASKISGWHVTKAFNEGESKVINKIIQVILDGVQPDGNEIGLIGIQSHMDVFNSFFCPEATKEVRVIGIYGMGGIGKTTIAQAVFQKFAYMFDGNSFVNNVREDAVSDEDICLLQEKILREILVTLNTFKISYPDNGAYMIRTRLSNKKVLLVLDDVDNVKQLQFLAATHEWFGPGSRIIITTRDEHLLVDAHFKYKPNCLLRDQAVELFCRHAFQKSIPSKGYEVLSYHAISYTGHLPLALKVLGSFLHGREATVWESALHRLEKAPNVEIFETLKLSFDGLDVSEKNIFLDIACFFKGKDKEHVIRILDSFGFDPVIGISVLIEKSLITVSNKKLGMHDLIQEMGWQIVRQSFSNSRLWEPKELHDIIKRNRKLKKIEAIVLPAKGCIDHYDGETLGYSDAAFRRMENLRLLDVGDLHISREPIFLPDKLQWLCWHHYRFSSLGVELEHMHKLVGLEMFGGQITHLWTGPKILPNLKFMDLGSSFSLTSFPDVSGAPNIERLILTDCKKLMEVHESLGRHRKLVYLDMSHCIQLKCLPSRLEMESLETLILSSCIRLGTFPEVSPSMSKLSNIYLDNCTQIEELPSSIRYLSHLRVLNLIGCQELKRLPEELGSMESLEELLLGLPGIRAAKSISCRSLTSLCSLRKLDLSYREINEEDFPQNFQAFSSLEELHLNGNSQLTQLPTGITCLSHLKVLALNKCCRLQSLHALPSGIQVLRATGCSALAKIGDLSNEYVWLYNVWLFDCHKLLEHQENEPYIDMMLHQNLLKKCATMGHRLSIAVPGSKIPSWFEEQQYGCTVALRLPLSLHLQVIGFAICGVFQGDWTRGYPRIIFRIINEEKVIPKSEIDRLESSTSDNCNLWVTYIPVGFFQQMYQDFQPQDWSHIKGSLVMTLINTSGNKSVKCGAHVVCQEDMEWIQQRKPCISNYGNMVHVDGENFHEKLHDERKVSANTYVYEEKSEDEESTLTPLRARTSERREVYGRLMTFCEQSMRGTKGNKEQQKKEEEQANYIPKEVSCKPSISCASMTSFKSNGRSGYDVFVSFRGEDTRNNFVDHLYAALFQRGVYTFKDDEMLRRGEQISLELLKAIEESRSTVVVFSENYVNSSWCLDELAKIMECHNTMGQRVLPVFYHVDPSDVRAQKGNFATAFQEHEEKFRGQLPKLIKWREALVAACNISGWHVSKSANVGENEFINKIIQDIFYDLTPHGMEADLIGIESHMHKLNSLLCTEATEEVRMIGIWGMGGIGKTTIAQAIFRRIAYKFECNCFVKDVRENSSSKRDICVLQEKILRETLVTLHTFMIQDPDHGANMIRTRFSDKKVLLVLDDVDNIKQLQFLAATHEWFGPGSRIIITTRDEHLLADAHFKYKPNRLLMYQAIELFSRHAFRKNKPPKGYEDLSYRAINYTGYLPLALTVLGSFFHGRQASVWGSALSRIAKAPNVEIFETLKLSFDGLDGFEKKIFLDIVCFFKGKAIEHVTRILDSFGFDPEIGISVLIEKSLITVSNKKLGMHDLIQEMGWQIVRQSFPESRLCKLEEIHDLLNENTVRVHIVQVCFFVPETKSNEAIVLPHKEYNDEHYDEKLGFSAEVFRKMKNLRLLDVDSRFTSCKPTFLPDKLRRLCWQRYPFLSLLVEHMCKLVGLEMFSGLFINLWVGRQILPNLKFIDLRESLHIRRFPNVSGAPNIERLILSDCKCLVEVHHSLGFHKRLVHLDMSGCKRLKSLPSMMEMESLETLILSSCFSLERFPEVSPSMTKLSNIYLDHCVLIEELPSSIRYLSALSFLNLISCKNLKSIPNSICELKNLKSLHLHNCRKLKTLPEELGSMEELEELLLGFPEIQDFERLQKSISFHTFTSLCSLRKLDLSWRQIEAEDFPQHLHAFSCLEELHLSGNSRLKRLPAGISHLSHLKHLELNKCCQLKILHGLPSGIQVLKARGCSSLEKIGDLTEEYECLYKISLLDCHKLLQNQESERCLDKMLQKSFLENYAAANRRLSIAIPGGYIPSWFKQRHGCNIVLNLPPKCHTQIIGFAVCGVFIGDWQSQYASPRIIFRFLNHENRSPKSEVDFGSASTEVDNVNVWISYIPFSFFQQIYHDFSEDGPHIGGDLVMTIMRTNGNKSVRCGGHIVYKEDVEPMQENRIRVSAYPNMVQVDGDDYQEDLHYDRRVSGNTYVYEEKSDDKNLDLMPLRTRCHAGPSYIY
ncbi:hypothetical protein OSB04_029127 [Centaurea solstitialis]|uniref:ADP-ribosyl cyclase/cyclic ADP-ribose hydrolase n=1 Tax=Centaurea solstitialis TaxID=347529 RepID=A0AA38STY8_9ASTR|nr:hypothetical protein OSB04_029127 [Centaurea solstitialis]